MPSTLGIIISSPISLTAGPALLHSGSWIGSFVARYPICPGCVGPSVLSTFLDAPGSITDISISHHWSRLGVLGLRLGLKLGLKHRIQNILVAARTLHVQQEPATLRPMRRKLQLSTRCCVWSELRYYYVAVLVRGSLAPGFLHTTWALADRLILSSSSLLLTDALVMYQAMHSLG
ncbi:hypothetical protein F5Y08DRAFT_104226 [Xylaria arbuscula]|nr:hypothetical protein F5Y08DRAFT_104226 [Xylaria arbuscula]